MQREYGDDIQVIFVHSQKGTNQQIVERQLENKWLGTNAMWTSEAPFRTDSGGLPAFALLDAEGKVVMSGISTRLMKPMKDKIAEMVKSGPEASEDVPKPVAKALEDLNEGEYSKALAALDKQIAKPSGGDAAIAQAAGHARAELMSRVEAHLARLNWMAQNGYADRAADGLKDFVKAAKGVADIQEGIASLQASLKSDAMKAELAAAKDLKKLEAKILEDPKGKHARNLEKFLEKHGSTSVAKRAKFWTDNLAS